MSHGRPGVRQEDYALDEESYPLWPLERLRDRRAAMGRLQRVQQDAGVGHRAGAVHLGRRRERRRRRRHRRRAAPGRRRGRSGGPAERGGRGRHAGAPGLFGCRRAPDAARRGQAPQPGPGRRLGAGLLVVERPAQPLRVGERGVARSAPRPGVDRGRVDFVAQRSLRLGARLLGRPRGRDHTPDRGRAARAADRGLRDASGRGLRVDAGVLRVPRGSLRVDRRLVDAPAARGAWLGGAALSPRGRALSLPAGPLGPPDRAPRRLLPARPERASRRALHAGRRLGGRRRRARALRRPIEPCDRVGGTRTVNGGYVLHGANVPRNALEPHPGAGEPHAGGPEPHPGGGPEPHPGGNEPHPGNDPHVGGSEHGGSDPHAGGGGGEPPGGGNAHGGGGGPPGGGSENGHHGGGGGGPAGNPQGGHNGPPPGGGGPAGGGGGAGHGGHEGSGGNGGHKPGGH